MNIEKQRKRFEENWLKYQTKFGTKTWKEDPNFIYFIEIPLAVELRTKMEQTTHNLKKFTKTYNGIWLPPQRMHITLALPGRMGEHFQGNDISFMKRKLSEITQKTTPFELVLGNINCFPDVIFREVLDEEGDIFRLHNSICKAIPFAQNPLYQFENYLPHLAIFYGETNPILFNHKEFERDINHDKMKVNSIFFGKARDEKGKYEKRILSEYKLGS